MPASVIKIDGIGRRYRIDQRPERYRELREEFCYRPVLGRSIDKPQRVLHSVAIDPDRCHKHDVVDDVYAIALTTKMSRPARSMPSICLASLVETCKLHRVDPMLFVPGERVGKHLRAETIHA